MKNKLYFLLGFCVLMIVGEVQAQKTDVYTSKQHNYYEALDLFRKEKYGAAQKKFQDFIAELGEKGELRVQAESYNALCALYLFNRDAEHYLLQFIEDHPDYAKMYLMYYELGNYYYRLKKYEDAIEWYDKLDPFDLDKDERSPYYFKNGYAFFQINQYQLAKTNFYEIKGGDDEYQEPALYYYSHISYLNKNYQVALKGFKSLDTSANFAPLAPYYIVQIYYLQGKYDKVLLYGEENLSRIKSKKQKEVTFLMADAAYRERKYRTAVKYFDSYATKTKKPSRETYFQIGYSNYQIGEYQPALDAFGESATEDDSLSQLANYYIGDIFIKLDKKLAAKQAFFYAFSYYGLDKDIQENALFNYAKLSYQTAESPFESAIDALKEYLKQFPNSVRREEIYTYLLNIYMTTNYYGLALESIEQVDNKDFRIKTAYQIVAFNYGVDLFQKGRFQKAIEMFNEVDKYPYEKDLNAKSVYWIAESYYRLEDYNNAIVYYQKFKNTSGAFNTEEYNEANYNIGYAYYNQEKYKESLPWFRKFVQDPEEKRGKKTNDVYLRIGDAFYMQENYKQAADAYSKALEINLLSPEHATYQLAMSEGYLSNSPQKIELLTTLVEDNPTSIYAPDAKFELAETYRSESMDSEALKVYDELIRDYGEKDFIKNAMLQGAIIENRIGNKENAIERLKYMIAQYPDESDTKAPLEVLSQIYKETSDIEKFKEYVASDTTLDYSMDQLELVQYEEAENLYVDGNWSLALEKLEKYLLDYEKPKKQMNAFYMAGESALNINDTLKALDYFTQINIATPGEYTEIAVAYLSKLYFNMERWDDATIAYKKLERISSNVEVQSNIQKNLMVCYYKLEDYPNALEYAKILQEGDLFSSDEKERAFLVEAKSQFALERYDIAAEEFRQIAENNNNEIGSEAKYLEAESQFKIFNLQQTEITLQELFERKPSYEYWVVKGYILIADLLLEQNDTTQAKLTYQSIINNYKGEELLNIAQNKFDELIEAENKTNTEVLDNEEEEEFQNDFLNNETTKDQMKKEEGNVELEDGDLEVRREGIIPENSELENVQPKKINENE